MPLLYLEGTLMYHKMMRYKNKDKNMSHMGPEHASREKKLTMVNFLIFVHPYTPIM